MALSQPKHRAFARATKRPAILTIGLIFCIGSVACAQAQVAKPNNANESWTATTQTSVANTNLSHRTESHIKSGNRSVDTLREEDLDLNGRYQPVYEAETETVQEDPLTTRKIVRTYRWDVNGQRNLTQVTEEEARSAANGEAHVVRETSNVDSYGNFQAMEREVEDTRQTSRETQETKTTFYLLDANGALTPSWQTQELRQVGTDQTMDVKKTTLRPDSSGSWQVSVVRENVTREDGKNRTSEERVWESDSEGRLSEVLRTAGKEEEIAAAEKSGTVETYSTHISGVAADGSLHLSQRVTTLQKKVSDVEKTEQQIEQPLPGDSRSGLQVSAKSESIVKFDTSSAQQSQILEIRDVNGTFNVVSVEARKLDQFSTE